MKITLYAMALMTALSTASFAADFSGKLMDASCADQNKQSSTATPGSTASTSPSTSSATTSSTSASSSRAACNATSATTAFAIEANGKTYKLDSTGNTKAAAALKSRADRSTDPTKAMSASYSAKVTGTDKDGTIAVETIDVQ